MSNTSKNSIQFKYYPGAACQTCADNGYRGELITMIILTNGNAKIVNCFDGEEHIHKSILDDKKAWTTAWDKSILDDKKAWDAAWKKSEEK